MPCRPRSLAGVGFQPHEVSCEAPKTQMAVGACCHKCRCFTLVGMLLVRYRMVVFPRISFLGSRIYKQE